MAILLFLAGLKVVETQAGVKVENSHYVAELSRGAGGLISRLIFKPTGEVLLGGMNVYTDYGIYGPGRRYVGTRNEQKPRLTVRRVAGRAVMTAEGRLKPSQEGRAIAYRARFTFDESPEIHLSLELEPNFSEGAVKAFLALCWALPSLSEWALNSPDGWLCQERGDGSRRDFMGLLNIKSPIALFLTAKGACLTIKGLRWDAPVPPQRVVVHGCAFFLCFYDGQPAPLVGGGKYRVSLSLVLGRGAPDVAQLLPERGVRKVIDFRAYLAQISVLMSKVPLSQMERAAEELWRAYKEGRTIFACGNGGSAATAMHFVCDLVKVASVPGRQRIKAMALTDNISVVTAWANDEAYEVVFEEQLRNFLQPGDVVVGISTSGTSENVLRAVEFAKGKGAITIGLGGRDGGRLKELVHIPVIVPGNHTGQIEDAHLVICHAWAYWLKARIEREG